MKVRLNAAVAIVVDRFGHARMVLGRIGALARAKASAHPMHVEPVTTEGTNSAILALVHGAPVKIVQMGRRLEAAETVVFSVEFAMPVAGRTGAIVCLRANASRVPRRPVATAAINFATSNVTGVPARVVALAIAPVATDA